MILAKAFVFFQLFSSALSTDLSGKETRIIGGFQAEENRYPYSVSLQDRFSGHFCGGSLILKDVVLTAAHCLGGTFDVVIGRDDFNDSDGEIISTRWQIGHPGYNTDTDENDLALIVLSNPVQNVVPLITLNDDSSYPSAGTIAYVMGWGVTDTGNNDPLPQQMQMVDVQVISNQDCETLERGGESYGGYGFGVYGSNICTYTEKKDACQGDSGGPLIIRGNDASQDVLVGVVSWGYWMCLSSRRVRPRLTGLRLDSTDSMRSELGYIRVDVMWHRAPYAITEANRVANVISFIKTY
jgi:trypsin